MADLHRVVGHQTVAPLHQLHGGLTLAHAGLPHEEDPLSVDIHQHAVAGDAGRQIGLQRRNDVAHEHAGGVRAAEDGSVILLGHLHTLGEGLNLPGNNQGRNVLGEQQFEALPPLLGGQPLQIGGLDAANHLEPLGVKVVEKSGELQARPVHVLRPDRHILVPRPAPQDLQAKFLNQFSQLYAVKALHWRCPLAVLLVIVYHSPLLLCNTLWKKGIF